MRIVLKATLATATTAALVGGISLATASTASAACKTRTEMRGGQAVSTSACSNGTTKSLPVEMTSGPAPGTGGLILRNSAGADLGSGIGENQNFKFVTCGPSGSGLIKVVQLKRNGGGGWGNLYKGYVKQAYTQIPSMFPCN